MKLCEKCLYFVQYYSMGKCKLHKANCGICKQNFKLITPTNINKCEYFTPKIEQIEKQNNNNLAIDILTNIEKTLFDLKKYLDN